VGLADSSGLILAARVGNFLLSLWENLTDLHRFSPRKIKVLTQFDGRGGNTPTNCYTELVVSSEGKTACKRWNSDAWGGYERVLPPEILHHIGKDKTQRLERTNGIVRQQTLSLAPQTE
jgi:hypothetical protein